MFDTVLNPEQQAVADFEGGPLCVVAGAGTGKTTALTARVAGVVERGTVADRVLLLTFTRRAARQMLRRARGRIGDRGRDVRGGTFHSVAHHTLRRHATGLGLPEGFSVIDTADACDVFDLVREELGWAARKDRRLPKKATLLDVYSRAVNAQQPLSSSIEAVAPWALDMREEIVEVCRSYVDRKRALALLDFDDLLLWHHAALVDDRLGPRLAQQWDHVLVDEYQDVNQLQVELLRALRRDDHRICVVGDDAQAIYGFRSASPRHLLDFEAAFPGAHTIVLHRNYRSSQAICDVANAIADDATEGFRARLTAHLPNGPTPELVHCHDEEAQAEEVCDRVLEAREAGTNLRDQAVLVRANHHSARLELVLSERKIPFVKYGGLRFLEAAHVKDLVCAFRLADNPHDELAWFRILQMLEGVGPATSRRVVDKLSLSGASVLEQWPDARHELPREARPHADKIVAALRAEPEERVAAHAERIRHALVPLVEQHYDDAPARLVDLETLVAAAHNASRLSEIAVELTLEPPISTSDPAGPPGIDDDWLVISTIHSAKGLEWDIVHVLSATDGNIPSDMALSTPSQIEEERRLFYVAVTRPRRRLHIYTPLRFHQHRNARDDLHTYAQPSRFLSERVTSRLERTQPAATLPSIERTEAASPRSIDLALDVLWK
jgi:DNA helicase-2/ATP-dependent DNA helicase PcrA